MGEFTVHAQNHQDCQILLQYPDTNSNTSENTNRYGIEHINTNSNTKTILTINRSVRRILRAKSRQNYCPCTKPPGLPNYITVVHDMTKCNFSYCGKATKIIIILCGKDDREINPIYNCLTWLVNWGT